MIKCFFVDVKDISSPLPRENFAESDLDRLADIILAVDGLLRPLIIKEIAPEKYIVIEGHREYYAALKAKEKDLNKAEMVNAFVVNKKNELSAIEQIKLLQDSSADIPRDRADRSEIIDILLPALASTIDRQIQPLIAQLAEQKQILESLRIDRDIALTIPEVIVDNIDLPPEPVEPIIIPVTPQIVVVPPKSKDTTKPDRAPKPPTSKEPKTPKTPKTPKSATPKALKETKSPSPQSPPTPTTNVDNSFRSPRAIEVIDLIDKLSREQLTIRMQRSNISQPILKLIDDIIDARDSQDAGKFHTWEAIVSAKIKGLGAARIQEIIEKLK